jgi:hypothetical protein
MYIRLIERYQQADPDRHVIMLYGHRARRHPAADLADLGMPPYAPPGEGDSYNFAMLHVTGGDIQFNGAGRARQIMLHTVVARRPATSFTPMEPPSSHISPWWAARSGLKMGVVARRRRRSMVV